MLIIVCVVGAVVVGVVQLVSMLAQRRQLVWLLLEFACLLLCVLVLFFLHGLIKRSDRRMFSQEGGRTGQFCVGGHRCPSSALRLHPYGDNVPAYDATAVYVGRYGPLCGLISLHGKACWASGRCRCRFAIWWVLAAGFPWAATAVTSCCALATRLSTRNVWPAT